MRQAIAGVQDAAGSADDEFAGRSHNYLYRWATSADAEMVRELDDAGPLRRSAAELRHVVVGDEILVGFIASYSMASPGDCT